MPGAYEKEVRRIAALDEQRIRHIELGVEGEGDLTGACRSGVLRITRGGKVDRTVRGIAWCIRDLPRVGVDVVPVVLLGHQVPLNGEPTLFAGLAFYVGSRPVPSARGHAELSAVVRPHPEALLELLGRYQATQVVKVRLENGVERRWQVGCQRAFGGSAIRKLAARHLEVEAAHEPLRYADSGLALAVLVNGHRKPEPNRLGAVKTDLRRDQHRGLHDRRLILPQLGVLLVIGQRPRSRLSAKRTEDCAHDGAHDRTGNAGDHGADDGAFNGPRNGLRGRASWWRGRGPGSTRGAAGCHGPVAVPRVDLEPIVGLNEHARVRRR